MMSSTMFYRLSGLALLIAGPVGLIDAVVSGVLYPGHHASAQQMASLPWMILAFMYLAGFLLLALGLPGMHRRQATRTGGLGVAGFVLTLIGVLVVGVLVGLLVVLPSPQDAQSSSAAASQQPGVLFELLFITIPILLIAIGIILLGAASLRADIYPRGTGVLLLIAGIIALVSLIVPSAIVHILNPLWNSLFFVAFGWFGAALVAQSKEGAMAPERASPLAQPSR
jgi:hypothetical protein